MAVDDAYARYRLLHRRELRALAQNHFPTLSPDRQRAEAGLIRAIGAIFGQHGTPEEKSWARAWLLPLLRHPEEKIRRYAILALPKLDSGPTEEIALLHLLERDPGPRERAHLTAALEKFGANTTLHWLRLHPHTLPLDPARLQANAARTTHPSGPELDRTLDPFPALRIHLRCRRGLEPFLRTELTLTPDLTRHFSFLSSHPGLCSLRAHRPFALRHLLTSRCCSSFSFVLGLLPPSPLPPDPQALAHLITSPTARRILSALHPGTPRYRIETGSVPNPTPWLRQVTTSAHHLWPDLLNDPRQAPWFIELHPEKPGISVELRPRFPTDPRFTYRVADHPAASHPPLAAALARWATSDASPDHVWDPFCGSGLELIERARLGRVASLHGTDLDPAALQACRLNLAAAGCDQFPVRLAACDFRDLATAGISPASLTLILTNPPLGRRLRIPGLRQLIHDLFHIATITLRPGGRLILANPIRLTSSPPGLTLVERRWADLGGFLCRLEHWQRTGPTHPHPPAPAAISPPASTA